MEINWYANHGRAYPPPGEKKEVLCGVCGVPMLVERNVMMATSLAEAIAGGQHACDVFSCPRISQSWHKRITKLKEDVYLAEINHQADYPQKKAAAEQEIRKLLAEQATQ